MLTNNTANRHFRQSTDSFVHRSVTFTFTSRAMALSGGIASALRSKASGAENKLENDMRHNDWVPCD